MAASPFADIKRAIRKARPLCVCVNVLSNKNDRALYSRKTIAVWL
jgi:hypothetical protein